MLYDIQPTVTITTDMKLNFQTLALLASLIFFALALTWMLAPQLFLSNWSVEFTTSAGLVGRRAAALYAGMGVMFFSARNAASPARSALLKGAAVACLMLAVLGAFELATGHAGVGILGAVFIEVALVLAFLAALFKELTDFPPQPARQPHSTRNQG